MKKEILIMFKSISDFIKKIQEFYILQYVYMYMSQLAICDWKK